MISKLDLSAKNIRKFGRVMFAALFILGLILFFKGKTTFKALWVIGFMFLAFARFSPGILIPVYKIWMGLAFCLGWVNTRIILMVIYYLVLTPIGLIARVFKKDFLSLKLNSFSQTYWVKREAPVGTREQYERIY